jgi:hypothetical protein
MSRVSHGTASRATAFGAIAAAALVLGCSQPLDLEGISSPPPLADAELTIDDGGGDRLTVSAGVAFAFTCTAPTTGNACTGVSATMADPSVASVKKGYLASAGPAASAMLVVIGMEEGRTTLTLTANEGSAVVDVVVDEIQ